jgi:hypothetical protein
LLSYYSSPDLFVPLSKSVRVHHRRLKPPSVATPNEIRMDTISFKPSCHSKRLANLVGVILMWSLIVRPAIGVAIRPTIVVTAATAATIIAIIKLILINSQLLVGLLLWAVLMAEFVIVIVFAVISYVKYYWIKSI